MSRSCRLVGRPSTEETRQTENSWKEEIQCEQQDYADKAMLAHEHLARVNAKAAGTAEARTIKLVKADDHPAFRTTDKAENRRKEEEAAKKAAERAEADKVANSTKPPSSSGDATSRSRVPDGVINAVLSSDQIVIIIEASLVRGSACKHNLRFTSRHLSVVLACTTTCDNNS